MRLCAQRVIVTALFILAIPWAAPWLATTAAAQGETVVLADPNDLYYVLAEEIAQREGIPLLRSLDQVLEQMPVFLLWVASPAHLSERVLVDFALAVRDKPSAISVGIISGTTMTAARELWLRADQVKGERFVVATAANPHGNIEAGITTYDDGLETERPLTRATLVRWLADADYLTFSGHGGSSWLGLDKDSKLQSGHIPSLPNSVIATGSCNTFQPWADGSIALAFVERGAAAYAGFVFSPNAGFLIGIYGGLPFRYTWPEFPIGHVVQVQNHGTLQGFAQIPFYFVLGDPRIALQSQAPYRLVDDQVSGKARVLEYADAPAGLVPVHIPGGAKYGFVEIVGVSAAWDREPFYNARLQMEDIQGDKYILFSHAGGGFSLRLHLQPSLWWVAGNMIHDALDFTLIYLVGPEAIIISLVLAAVLLGWSVLRRWAHMRVLFPAALTGLGFAALHGLYTLARIDDVTITSKHVVFRSSVLFATFVSATAGAFLFLSARSRLGRAAAVPVAAGWTLAATVSGFGVVGLGNTFFVRPKLGTGLWNYTNALQPLIVLVIECILFAVVFSMLQRCIWPAQNGGAATKEETNT
jgi:hypothetical protein